MQIKKIVTGYLEENCYVIYDDKKCLIVDPGSDEDKIDKFILKNELKVNGILVTHHHFDHIGVLDHFVSKYKTKIYDFNNVEKSFKVGRFSFNVVPTFGHTMDSVTFYFEEEKIMFTGDFLFKESIGRYDFEDSDGVEMQKSIKLIKEYDPKIKVYPGHGDTTTLKYEFSNNVYLK